MLPAYLPTCLPVSMTTLLAASAVAFLLSLFARMAAETVLMERVPIIGEFIGLSLVRNAGVAFGITFPPLLQVLLVAGALSLVLFLAWRSCRTQSHALGFGLIIGGALANIVDRLDDGLVTDFFQIGSFPTFNVADSCITVGVGVLLLWEVLKRSPV